MQYILTEEEMNELKGSAYEEGKAEKENRETLKAIFDNTKRVKVEKRVNHQYGEVEEVFTISFTSEGIDENFLRLLRLKAGN